MDDLFEAAFDGDIDTLKQLIQKGYYVGGFDEDDGCTPLYMAAGNGHIECVKLLLESKANVNKGSTNEETPVSNAAYNGQVDCVKLLIEWKANLNTIDGNGECPLHWAVSGGYLACIEVRKYRFFLYVY